MGILCRLSCCLCYLVNFFRSATITVIRLDWAYNGTPKPRQCTMPGHNPFRCYLEWSCRLGMFPYLNSDRFIMLQPDQQRYRLIHWMVITFNAFNLCRLITMSCNGFQLVNIEILTPFYGEPNIEAFYLAISAFLMLAMLLHPAILAMMMDRKKAETLFTPIIETLINSEEQIYIGQNRDEIRRRRDRFRFNDNNQSMEENNRETNISLCRLCNVTMKILTFWIIVIAVLIVSFMSYAIRVDYHQQRLNTTQKLIIRIVFDILFAVNGIYMVVLAGYFVYFYYITVAIFKVRYEKLIKHLKRVRALIDAKCYLEADPDDHPKIVRRSKLPFYFKDKLIRKLSIINRTVARMSKLTSYAVLLFYSLYWLALDLMLFIAVDSKTSACVRWFAIMFIVFTQFVISIAYFIWARLNIYAKRLAPTIRFCLYDQEEYPDMCKQHTSVLFCVKFVRRSVYKLKYIDLDHQLTSNAIGIDCGHNFVFTHLVILQEALTFVGNFFLIINLFKNYLFKQ